MLEDGGDGARLDVHNLNFKVAHSSQSCGNVRSTDKSIYIYVCARIYSVNRYRCGLISTIYERKSLFADCRVEENIR